MITDTVTDPYAAACRLLDAISPGLKKLPTTTGVIAQIDNAVAGLRLDWVAREDAYKSLIRSLRNDIEHIVQATLRKDYPTAPRADGGK